jgi:hypothetical protein
VLAYGGGRLGNGWGSEMWTFFQIAVFGGTVALLMPYLEKGEGRAAGIIAVCVAFAATWLLSKGIDLLRRR